MASDLPKDAPAPRLCHLVKWPDFEGYGFNLHAEKAKTGQFIGKVDEGSPAELAGLREGDRIIEVNGVNIANENHRQVVERIKAMVNETKLLVIDEEGDRYYKDRKLVVKGTQSNVSYKKTPPSKVSKEEEVIKVVDKKDSEPSETKKMPPSPKKSPERVSSTDKNHSLNGNHQPATPPEDSPKKRQDSPKPVSKPKSESPKPVSKPKSESPKPVSKPKSESPKPATKPVDDSPKPAKTTSEPAPKSVAEVKSNGAAPKGSSKSGPISNGANGTQNGPAGGDLNLNMSAAEMREMLANRKKRDPRNQSLDMREKYQIVQQM